ncbi:MAG: hypothetical protein J6O49_09755 [Bacteroidaceae bacterium]|nr:hypothetical protein [Bacteroidaceae bacterium]
MKKSLIFIFGLALLMTGCRAHLPVAQQGGKDDVAYLLFVGQKEYGGEQVQVSIDGAAPFTAEVVKVKKASRKGTQYAIATGTRDLKVTSDGKILYQKKIFVSTQEVKQIMLP